MKLAVVAVAAFLAGGVTGWLVRRPAAAPGNRSQQVKAAAPAGPSAADLAGIDQLHQEDISATLSGDPAELAKLWTDDAVRLEPGGPAEVGKKTIEANDWKDRAAHPGAAMVSYKPHFEALHVLGDWAYEWDYFDASFRNSPKGKAQSFRAKALRVLQKQKDGSWKFAAVMWNLARP